MSRFMVRAMIWGGVFFLSYAFFIELERPVITKTPSQWGDNIVGAQGYIYQEIPSKFVIVGSSLSARLPKTALGDEFYNLAFSAGSQLTGLALVRYMSVKPEVVIVEANILDKSKLYDQEFINSVLQEPVRTIRQHVLALRYEYQPVNLLLSLFKSMYGQSPEEKMLAQPVESTLRHMLDLRMKDAVQPLDMKNMQVSIDFLKAMIDELQQQKVRVVFVNLPIDDQLVGLNQYSVLKQKMFEVFPINSYEWLDIQNNHQYLTTDGIHLIYPDAYNVASLIKQYVESK